MELVSSFKKFTELKFHVIVENNIFLNEILKHCYIGIDHCNKWNSSFRNFYIHRGKQMC